MNTKHNMTVTTQALIAGDVLLQNGNKVVESTKRDMQNLGATIIRFTDGSWFHAGTFDAHAIARH